MANFFDQFDGSSQAPPESNFFDQFDDKTRSWSDVPMEAIGNIPDSAVRTAKAIIHPILHPIDTVKALFDTGYGAASKAAGAIGVTQDPTQKSEDEAAIDGVISFIKGRYGSMDDFKNTVATDPIGVLADGAVVLTGGGAAVERAPGVVGKVGAAAKSAGSAIDPIANVARAGNVVGKTASAVLGTSTGAGSLPVEMAYKAGIQGNRTFLDHMRGNAEMDEAIDMAKNAVREFGKDRQSAYKSGIASTQSNAGTINYAPILNAGNEAYNMVVYRPGGKGSSASTADIPKSDAAAKVYNEIGNMVNRFRSTKGGNTAEGIDALKQAIGEVRQKTQPGTLERKVADHVYHAVKNEIVKQVPEYAKTMKDYSAASEQINELTRTFSLGEKSAKDTALRKLTSSMRNNVNTNYGQRAKMIDELARKEPNLPAALAGQSMSSPTPRGMAHIPAMFEAAAAMAAQNPMLLAGLPFSSPRLVGEGAYYAGRASSVPKVLLDLADPQRLQNALMAAYGMNTLAGNGSQ